MNRKHKTLACAVAMATAVCCMANAAPPDLLDVLHANHAINDAQYAQLKQQAARHPGTKPAPKLLDVLRTNHVITESQYTELAGRTQEKSANPPMRQTAKVRTPKAPAARHTATASESERPGGLPKIDGYLQFDAPLAVAHATTLGSRTNLRRFYVHLHDTIAPGWAYSTTFGYYNGKTYFASGDVTYSGFDRLAITAGYFKEPFSLSYLSSPKNLLFPERPLPVQALVPGKKIGVALRTHGDRWSVSGGVFGGAYDQTAAAPAGVTGRSGASLRGTFVPWTDGNSVWEVGASIAWRKADSNHSVAFGYLPESFTVGTKLAQTPTIRNTSSFWSADAETLLHAGPFSLQGEYLRTHVQRDDAPSPTFHGWYAQAGWSLTGEQRRFSPASGVLGGLTPDHPVSAGGWGAWELAARYSVLDLDSADISGGFERNASVGVNWYPEKALKFMLDGIRVLPVRGGPEPDLSTTIWMLRLQAAY